MLKKHNRYDEYAYRIATLELDPSVTKLEEGQFVTVNEAGKLVIADGTKKAFMAIGSKRVGRDQIGGVPVKKVSFLVGQHIQTTSCVDTTQTYKAMSPLKLKADGVLTLADPDKSLEPDPAHKIVGYALGALSADKFLKVIILP